MIRCNLEPSPTSKTMGHGLTVSVLHWGLILYSLSQGQQEALNFILTQGTNLFCSAAVCHVLPLACSGTNLPLPVQDSYVS